MTPHQRYGQTKNFLTEQFNRATPEEGELVSRSGMLPLGEYSSGAGLAWPSFVAEPALSVNRLIRNGYQRGDVDAVGDATNALLSFVGGSFGIVRPRNSLGAGGRHITNEERERIKFLREIGVGNSEIANAVGITRGAVSNVQRRMGLQPMLPGSSGWKDRAAVDRLSHKDRDAIAQYVHEAKDRLPVNEIANLYGLHPADVVRLTAMIYGP